MTRHKHPWDRFCTLESIKAAAREALAGGRGKGSGARFFAGWEMEVGRLPRYFFAARFSSMAAWAAARRATGTRKGEQLT